MAALDFLRRNHTVSAAYFDHGSDNSKDALAFVQRYCDTEHIPLVIGTVNKERGRNESVEAYWRDQRYGFLDALSATVVTAHHLDDAVETWVWGSLNGQPKLPQLHRGTQPLPLRRHEFSFHCDCSCCFYSPATATRLLPRWHAAPSSRSSS